jgi:hypothetical protein
MGRCCIGNSFTEFDENPINNLVADTGSQTDVRVHANNAFLLCKILERQFCVKLRKNVIKLNQIFVNACLLVTVFKVRDLYCTDDLGDFVFKVCCGHRIGGLIIFVTSAVCQGTVATRQRVCVDR